MTKQEICERFQIPFAVLEVYEKWLLYESDEKTVENRQYDDLDIERLSLILTLRDIGFTAKENESYMLLYLAHNDTRQERLFMLEQRRAILLDEIHNRETQLDQLDYLRYKIQKS